jgi:hypothetical protein
MIDLSNVIELLSNSTATYFSLKITQLLKLSDAMYFSAQGDIF